MKPLRYCLLVALLAAAPTAAGQEDLFGGPACTPWTQTTTLPSEYRLVQTVEEFWDSDAWRGAYLHRNVYNAEGVRTDSLVQDWDGVQWVDGRHLTFTYDAYGRLTQTLVMDWNSHSSEWREFGRSSYTHDDAGNLVQEVHEEAWPGGRIESWQYTYSYDAAGRMTQWIYLNLWNRSDTWLYICTYDDSGRLAETLQHSWDGSRWSILPVYRYVCTYDESGNLTQYLTQFFSAGGWANDWVMLYAYDAAGNRIDEVTRRWSDGHWWNEGRESRTYDEAGKLATRTGWSWDSGLRQWISGCPGTYHYDAAGNLEYDRSWERDSENNCVLPFGRTTFTWEAVTVATEGDVSLPTEFALSQNYPNPFNPTTTILYDLPQAADVTLTVYDLLGRTVRELASGTQPAGTYEVSFDATRLHSGIYFYRLSAGDYGATKRMVVVK